MGLPEVEAKIDVLTTKVNQIAQQIENLELVQYCTCTMCQGSGQVIPSHNPTEPTPAPITCSRCNGAGKIILGEAIEKD